jgi:hypothetical protein
MQPWRSLGEPTDSDEAWRLSERNLLLGVGALLALGIALGAIAFLVVGQKPSISGRVGSGIAGSFAGALVGTSMTILLSRLLDHSPLAQVRELLARSIGSSMTSAEGDVSPLRATWHHYYTTLIDGQMTWRYNRIAFGIASGVGTLSTETLIEAPDGIAHPYRVEAAVRGPRLILTQTALHGKESAAVEVFPHIGFGFRTVHAGVGLMQSWDGSEIAARCIMSRQPLAQSSEVSAVEETGFAALDAAWESAFAGIRDFVAGPREPDDQQPVGDDAPRHAPPRNRDTRSL